MYIVYAYNIYLIDAEIYRKKRIASGYRIIYGVHHTEYYRKLYTLQHWTKSGQSIYRIVSAEYNRLVKNNNSNDLFRYIASLVYISV